MKRREIYRKIWNDCRGLLAPGNRIAILGGGISGLHLAWFLQAENLRVTVYEPQPCGGLRIPLVHACDTAKAGPRLWETAAAFSRAWYAGLQDTAGFISAQKNARGDFFVVKLRSYLRFLKTRLVARGVVFRELRADGENFDLTFAALGRNSLSLFPRDFESVTHSIPGWESYFSTRGLTPSFSPQAAERNEITANFMVFPPRAGLIHRNNDSRETVALLARSIFPKGRGAIFHGTRLAARDRNPIIGFFPPGNTRSYDRLRENFRTEKYARTALAEKSPYFFTAMGYHAMTYAPYLAHAVAGCLTGKWDENLVCTLTPARFLPRS